MLLDTPNADIGWQAQEFTLPSIDGTSYSFSDLMQENGLLIAFICNHCPYVKTIADRLVTDANSLLAQGIGVVAINANDYRYVPEDSPDKMREFSSEHNFSFPYLIDEQQSVAKAFDAVCTPDFFGFNNQGKLQYRGRLDNTKMADTGERITELVNAMELIANTGAGPIIQHASMGCSIKWK